VGIERGLPQLARVHLAETFIALQRDVLAAHRGHRFEQADRTIDRALLALAAQHAGAWIILLERQREFVELAGVGRTEQRMVDGRDVLTAPDGTLDPEALALQERADPAALGFLGKGIEPPGNKGCSRSRLFRVAENTRVEHPENGGLLDHLTVVAA